MPQLVTPQSKIGLGQNCNVLTTTTKNANNNAIDIDLCIYLRIEFGINRNVSITMAKAIVDIVASANLRYKILFCLCTQSNNPRAMCSGFLCRFNQ